MKIGTAAISRVFWLRASISYCDRVSMSTCACVRMHASSFIIDEQGLMAVRHFPSTVIVYHSSNTVERGANRLFLHHLRARWEAWTDLDFIISHTTCRHVQKVRQMQWVLRQRKNLPMGFEKLMHWFVSEVSTHFLPLRLCKGACFTVFAIRDHLIKSQQLHDTTSIPESIFTLCRSWKILQSWQKSLYCFTALYCIRPLHNFQLESCWKQAARQWSLGYGADQPVGKLLPTCLVIARGRVWCHSQICILTTCIYIYMCRHNFILKSISRRT